jgi:hypothetical protein
MAGPEAPKEAVNEEAAAAKKMGDVMPDMETKTEDQPIEAEELKKLSKGYPEIDAKGHQDIVNDAKRGIKEASKANDNLHKSTFVAVGKDGYEYVYIYDNTNTPKDRLFRSENPVVSVENEYAAANLKDGYKEATGKRAETIAKAIVRAKVLGGEPPTGIVNIGDLVANRILTQEDADAIDGDVAFAIKIKGKVKIYFGWAKA